MKELMKHTQRHIKAVIAGVILILAASTITEVNAQTNTAQAIMEVRAEVVSGTQIQNEFNGNIAGQMNQQETREESSTKEVDLGHFTITVPEGAEYSVRFDDDILMENGTHKWTIETSFTSKKGEKGEVTFKNSGSFDSGEEFSGTYTGTQKATIEFD